LDEELRHASVSRLVSDDPVNLLDNVAISRSKCLAIIVGHPSLGRGQCSTLRQMTLSNLFCRAMAEAEN
jgi:hypothetical protein